MARLILFCITLCCNITLANAQRDSNYINFNKAYFKSIVLDVRDVALFPKYMNKKDALVATGGVLLASSAFVADKKWAAIMQNNQHKNITLASKYVFEPFGSALYSIPLLVGFYTHGALANNIHTNRVAMLGIKAFAISGLVAQLPKYITQRERPYTTLPSYNPFLFHVFGSTKNHSFYSGHTTTAFAIATIIAQEYKHKPWIAVLSYTMATGVALSRNYDNKHWLSDVAFGALTGYGISRLIYRQQNHKRGTKKTN